MTCEYILNKYKRNSKILEMACSLGFVTHALTKKGYDVKAFDISDKAIGTAKNLANQLGQNSKKFYVSDEKF